MSHNNLLRLFIVWHDVLSLVISLIHPFMISYVTVHSNRLLRRLITGGPVNPFITNKEQSSSRYHFTHFLECRQMIMTMLTIINRDNAKTAPPIAAIVMIHWVPIVIEFNLPTCACLLLIKLSVLCVLTGLIGQ